MSFVDAHDFSVDLVVRVLGIPASTYYDWRARQAQPSRRAREDAELLAMIDEIRGSHEFAATYGSPRVWLELRNRGVKVGRKRVERIMRVNGRQGTVTLIEKCSGAVGFEAVATEHRWVVHILGGTVTLVSVGDLGGFVG